MALGGWCAQCAAWVWVDDRTGACLNGHGAEHVTHFYDPATGGWVAPPWSVPQAVPAEAPAPVQPAPAPAPVQPAPAPQAVSEAVPATQPNAVIAEIANALRELGGYTLTTPPDSDLAIASELADARWLTGTKKVTFEALLKAEPSESRIYYWEMLKESGAGTGLGWQTESWSVSGTRRSGSTKGGVFGTAGAADHDWDYARTRSLVEEICARHGWTVKTVLRKKSATR